jgi:hypothetical protein
MEEIQNNKSKKLKNLFSVILIGAIGSGLWDIFLKKIFFKIGDIFVSIATYFNKSYVDHIYRNVGKGSTLQYMPSVLIIFFYMLFPFLTIITLGRFFKKPSAENSDKTIIKSKGITHFFRTKRRIYVFALLITIPITISYTDMLLSETSTIRTFNYIDRNLEIVRPYITDLEYYSLRSKFRLIDNHNKLEDFLNSLKKIATINNITLPAKDFYGIK